MVNSSLLSTFENMFGDWSTYNTGIGSGSRGTYHCVKTDDGYTLHIGVMGYEEKDLSVEINSGRLTIMGKIPEDRKHIAFVQNIELVYQVPSNLMVNSAHLSRGILSVCLRQIQKTEPVKIPIQQYIGKS